MEWVPSQKGLLVEGQPDAAGRAGTPDRSYAVVRTPDISPPRLGLVDEDADAILYGITRRRDLTMTVVLAGAATFRIDPPLPCDPQGFVRRAAAVREHGAPLSVRACVIRSGDLDVAIVAGDITGLDAEFAERIRRVIEETTGVSGKHVLLSSTHSHASLWARTDQKLHGEFDDYTDGERAYFARLPYDYATAVVSALERLVPARVAGAVGCAPGLAVNRRERTVDGRTILGWNRDGFIDEEVPTIRIDAHDGSPIATLVGFGCHPVVLGGEVALTGPDFIGELRDRVEMLHGGICIFLQGAAGNVLPLEAFSDRPGPERTMGARLALEAVHVIADRDPRVMEIERIEYGSVTPIHLYRHRPAVEQPAQPVAVRSVQLELPLLESPSVGEMENELAEKRSEVEELLGAGADRAQLNPVLYHVRWLEAMLARRRDAPPPDRLSTEIWAVRFGDTAVVGTPGELFTELGAEVRRRSPFATTIFAGYCHGVLGYMATAEEYPFGGYEPAVSHRGYGHPAPFAPEAGRVLVEASVELLDSLATDLPPA